jgi:hypothetical protein
MQLRFDLPMLCCCSEAAAKELTSGSEEKRPSVQKKSSWDNFIQGRLGQCWIQF